MSTSEPDLFARTVFYAVVGAMVLAVSYLLSKLVVATATVFGLSLDYGMTFLTMVILFESILFCVVLFLRFQLIYSMVLDNPKQAEIFGSLLRVLLPTFVSALLFYVSPNLEYPFNLGANFMGLCLAMLTMSTIIDYIAAKVCIYKLAKNL